MQYSFNLGFKDWKINAQLLSSQKLDVALNTKVNLGKDNAMIIDELIKYIEQQIKEVLSDNNQLNILDLVPEYKEQIEKYFTKVVIDFLKLEHFAKLGASLGEEFSG